MKASKTETASRCPFCGAAVKCHRHDYMHPAGEFWGFVVNCENLRCHIQPSTYDANNAPKTRAKAWRLWGLPTFQIPVMKGAAS